MISKMMAARGARRWLAGAIVAAGVAGAANAASAATYLGAALTEVKTADRIAVSHPQPVQLIFQFETKGAPNARATKLVKQQVIDAVKATGLFSDVSESPTPNGAILSLAINDVASPKDMKDASTQGAVTGATFFIAGSNVVDHYVCTADYVAGPNAGKVSKTAEQSMIFQMGLINSPPENAVKIGSLKDALATMIRQLVGNSLNDLAKDPGFQVADAGATQAPAAPTVTEPAPVSATGASTTGASTTDASTATTQPASVPAPVKP